MVILFILGIILLFAGLGLFLGRNSFKEEDKAQAKGAGIGITGLGTLLLIISLVLGSLVTIPAGYTGVVLQFSGVTGAMLDQGLRTKMPFVQTVVKMDTRTQKYEASATSASQDLQDVSTTIALNYRLREEAAADVYKTLGINYIEKIASPAIHETVKQITAKFIAEDLILRRDEVKARITETLYNRLSERGIEVEIVSITDFRFSSTFTAAIEAKVAAEQAVLEAENKLKRVRVEAEQREAEAKGEANARIAQALGEAQYIETVTAAQVAANKAINETLTPEVLQYILLDRLGDDIKLIVVPSNSDMGLVLPQISP